MRDLSLKLLVACFAVLVAGIITVMVFNSSDVSGNLVKISMNRVVENSGLLNNNTIDSLIGETILGDEVRYWVREYGGKSNSIIIFVQTRRGISSGKEPQRITDYSQVEDPSSYCMVDSSAEFLVGRYTSVDDESVGDGALCILFSEKGGS